MERAVNGPIEAPPPPIQISGAAGYLLRKLRHQRGLTLKLAAAALNTSPPVLSRKERGEDVVERQDIRFAVKSYQLTAWEAYELWTAAGFLPEPTPISERIHNLHEQTEALLQNIAFPAFVMDSLGYIRAWNQGIEAIWAPSSAQGGPQSLHIIDDLFSARLRERLGHGWEAYVAQSLKIFYHKVLRIANDPEFRMLMETLHVRHGAEFARKWNEAQSSSNGIASADSGPTIVVHDSQFGPIQYLVMQTVFQLPQHYELITYVPSDAANQERYQQFKATMGANRLYFNF